MGNFLQELQESSELPTYGPFEIVSNGLSQMEFDMTLSLVNVRDGAPDKTTPVGTWSAGLNSNISFIENGIMDKFTSALVYRVVVAEVRLCEITSMESIEIFSCFQCFFPNIYYV